MAQDKEIELIVPLQLTTMQRLAVVAIERGVSKNRMATRLIEFALTHMDEPLETSHTNPAGVRDANGIPKGVNNLRRTYL